jgi:hypothetical protein
MPFIVAHSVVSFLRRRAYTKKHEDRAAEKDDELAFQSPTSSTRISNEGSIFFEPRPTASVRRE